MENFFSLLILVSLILFVIGIFKPSTSLFWYKKERTRKKSLLIYGVLIIVSFVLFGITSDTKYNTQASEKNSVNVEKKSVLTQAQMDSVKLVQHEADSIAEVARIAAERTAKIEKQFSSWDGAHRNLEKYIKDHMNDPDSYEHVETKYWDLKDHLVVLTTFRGKNAFGGKVINTVKAKVDLDGNVIEIIEQF